MITISEADAGAILIVIGAVVGLIEATKRIFPDFTKDKEPILSFLACVALTVLLKLTGAAFAGLNWGWLVVIMLVKTVGAAEAHDKILNPLIGKKSGGN